MQRKFIKKALIYITLLQQIYNIITADQVETPVLTYDETAVTQAKMESSGMNVTSLLSSRQSTSDH